MFKKILFFFALSFSPALSQTLSYEFIVVERVGCPYCAAFKANIAPIYPKTAFATHAPLRYFDLDKSEKSLYRFTTPPLFTPTFVLVKEGKEIARFEGFSSDEFFWVHLKRLFAKAGMIIE